VGKGLDRQGFKLIERCCTTLGHLFAATVLLINEPAPREYTVPSAYALSVCIFLAYGPLVYALSAYTFFDVRPFSFPLAGYG
jgi:hypothetical protein